MKAYVVEHPGGPEVLELKDVATPKVKPGWTLVKVLGFGINHSEIFTREGKSPSVKFPRILGIEVVGKIVASSVPQQLTPGQTVISIMGEMGRQFDGSYAEDVLLPNDQVYPVQTTLSIANLAAIPETYYTAFGIAKSLQIQANDEVLIQAATSGVGIAVCRLIKAFNAHVKVTGTSRTAAKENQLLHAGFDKVIVAPNSRELPANCGAFDKIVNLIGPLSVPDALQHLKEFGILNSTGQLGGVWTLDDFDPITAIPNNRYLTSFYSGDVSQTSIQEMLDFLAKYQVDVQPAKTFSFDHLRQAHAYLNSHESFGKVVIVM